MTADAKFSRLVFLGFPPSSPPAALLDVVRAWAREVTVIDSADTSRLAAADAVVVPLGFPVERRLLTACSRLRCLIVLGTDLSKIDNEAARELGVTVHNLAGYSTESVAELVFGLLLVQFRNLDESRRRAERGLFSEPPWSGEVLRGKRFGVIGLGSIGEAVANIASLGFGADVLYWSRTRRPICERELRICYRPLDDLLQEAEVISVHLALEPETKLLLDSRRIGLIRPKATLIHLSPLDIIDLPALELRLSREEVRFLFDHGDELAPDMLRRLTQHQACVAYPPIGYTTKQADARRAQLLVEVLGRAMINV